MIMKGFQGLHLKYEDLSDSRQNMKELRDEY